MSTWNPMPLKKHAQHERLKRETCQLVTYFLRKENQSISPCNVSITLVS